MPIRLIGSEISKPSCDAEVRALRIDNKQNIIRCFEDDKVVFLVKAPIWVDGTKGESELLGNFYAEILRQAENNNCQSIVMPLELHPNTFPNDIIYPIAIKAINEYLNNSDLTVYLLVSDAHKFKSGFSLKDKLQEYISKVYIPKSKLLIDGRFGTGKSKNLLDRKEERYDYPPRRKIDDEHRFDGHGHIPSRFDEEHQGYIQIPESILKRLDVELGKEFGETFTEMVLRLIDEKGMTDPQCYKKANMDKRLFSKIRSNSKYHPEKETAIVLALALELSLSEARTLLAKAGYALSPIDERDVIVEFFIKEKQYSVMAVNGVLYEKGLKLLSNYDPEL